MALQLGVNARNAELNGITTQIGATGTLKIFTGAVPANCAAGDPAGLLVTINLPNPAWAAASAGAMVLNGTWSASASGAGIAASYRMYDSSSACQQQGNVTTDLVLNNTSIAIGQTVTITTSTLTAGNA